MMMVHAVDGVLVPMFCNLPTSIQSAICIERRIVIGRAFFFVVGWGCFFCFVLSWIINSILNAPSFVVSMPRTSAAAAVEAATNRRDRRRDEWDELPACNPEKYSRDLEDQVLRVRASSGLIVRCRGEAFAIRCGGRSGLCAEIWASWWRWWCRFPGISTSHGG